MIKKQKHNITILWKDAVLYDAQYEPRTSLTPTKCQGEFVKEDRNFVIDMLKELKVKPRENLLKSGISDSH